MTIIFLGILLFFSLLMIVGLFVAILHLKLKLKAMRTLRTGCYSTVNDQQAASQEAPPTLIGNVCYGQLNADAYSSNDGVYINYSDIVADSQ